MRWISILLFLLAARPLWGQEAPIPANVSVSMAMFDSSMIVGATCDTSRSQPINGHGLAAYFAQYHSRNDSLNIEVSADFSPDGKHWLHTVGLDTAIVSGAADATEAKRLDTLPDWAMFLRLRVKNNAAATDTADVTVWIVRHHFEGMRLR